MDGSEPRFRRSVYALVRRIPRGKVVTYGEIAALLGRPRSARAVGTALGTLRGSLLDTVPWQRVVNAAGRCSHKDEFWADVQRELLECEGVRFDGRGRVDLERAVWAASARRLAARKLRIAARPRQHWTGRRINTISAAVPR